MVDPNIKIIIKKSLKFKWKTYVNVKCRENLISQMYSLNDYQFGQSSKTQEKKKSKLMWLKIY